MLKHDYYVELAAEWLWDVRHDPEHTFISAPSGDEVKVVCEIALAMTRLSSEALRSLIYN